MHCFVFKLCFFQEFLPPTAPFFTTRALESEKITVRNGVLNLGNGGVAAELCLEYPFWPPLPKEGVIQWWGPPVTKALKN